MNIMKYTQQAVDRSFEAYRESEYHSVEDVERIKRVIHDIFGITFSTVQAIDFWKWRSDEWCAGWLIIGPDEEIIRWFTVWMDWASRDFKGFPITKEHLSDPLLNMFGVDEEAGEGETG
jgi:hypothetical protein